MFVFTAFTISRISATSFAGCIFAKIAEYTYHDIINSHIFIVEWKMKFFGLTKFCYINNIGVETNDRVGLLITWHELVGGCGIIFKMKCKLLTIKETAWFKTFELHPTRYIGWSNRLPHHIKSTYLVKRPPETCRYTIIKHIAKL